METESESRNCRVSIGSQQNGDDLSVQEPNRLSDADRQQLKQKQAFNQLYRIQGKLGVGSYGTVYAGIRTEDSLPVAIKTFPRKKVHQQDKSEHRTVPLEVALMMRVPKHPGVIKLLDWHEDRRLNTVTIIMERPPNSINLLDFMREKKVLNENQAWKVFKQVVSAVRYIHSRDVFHRDIKPENIIINRHTLDTKVIDFGCATLVRDGYYYKFAGTPAYFPPEWFVKRRYKAESATVWSLGVLLYRMVCGDMPYKTEGSFLDGKIHFKVPLSKAMKSLISLMLNTKDEERPSLLKILSLIYIHLSSQ